MTFISTLQQQSTGIACIILTDVPLTSCACLLRWNFLSSSLLLAPTVLSSGLPPSLDSSLSWVPVLSHSHPYHAVQTHESHFGALPPMTSNPRPFQCFSTRLELHSGFIHSPALYTLSLNLTMSCELHWLKKNHKKARNQNSYKYGAPALTRSNFTHF